MCGILGIVSERVVTGLSGKYLTGNLNPGTSASEFAPKLASA
ncbi:MAG TPA: hypothetical protein VEZ71_03705 [Archangium sp.]|nr:hypothetical protein [Archangium sp.]